MIATRETNCLGMKDLPSYGKQTQLCQRKKNRYYVDKCYYRQCCILIRVKYGDEWNK
jgi:hypothetical protein